MIDMPWCGNVKFYTDIEKASVYANGLNMVKVHVHYEIADKSKKEKQANKDERLALIKLIVYETGEEIKLIDTPTIKNPATELGWLYCRKANNFVNESSDAKKNIDGEDDFILYVLCNDFNGSRSINIGVIIMAPDGATSVEFSSHKNQIHPPVSVQSKENKSPNLITRDDIILTARRMSHDNELNDDGSEFNKNQPVDNAWRQFNFYFQLKGGKKISAMEINRVSDDNKNMFSENANNCFRTKAYLWGLKEESAEVNLWDGDNNKRTVVASDIEDAFCVTYITVIDLGLSSYTNSFKTFATLYDESGNSCVFYPNHILPESYKEIVELFDNYDSPAVIDKIITLGSNAVKEPEYKNIKNISIFNIGTSRYLFPFYLNDNSGTPILGVGNRAESNPKFFWSLGGSDPSPFRALAPTTQGAYIFDYKWSADHDGDHLAMYLHSPDVHKLFLKPIWLKNAFYFFVESVTDGKNWVKVGHKTDSQGDIEAFLCQEGEVGINNSSIIWQMRSSIGY